jgi:hypothetical protein
MLFGASHVWLVNATGESAQYAEAAPGQTRLAAASAGTAQVLWEAPFTGSEVHRAVVRFPFGRSRQEKEVTAEWPGGEGLDATYGGAASSVHPLSEPLDLSLYSTLVFAFDQLPGGYGDVWYQTPNTHEGEHLATGSLVIELLDAIETVLVSLTWAGYTVDLLYPGEGDVDIWPYRPWIDSPGAGVATQARVRIGGSAGYAMGFVLYRIRVKAV